MKDFCLSKDTITKLFETCMELAQEGKRYRVTIVEWKDKRTLSMNALQHAIYGDISKYLIKNGRTDWTPKKVKFNLKSKFLGWYKQEIVDITTGEVTVKELLIETSGLDKGDSYHYTTQIIEWAEVIGCELRVQSECEYNKLKMEQEK